MCKLITVADLGATKTLVGLATPEGKLLFRSRYLTIADDAQRVIDEIAAAVKKIWTEAGLGDNRLSGLVAGAPGPITHPEGMIIDSPNLCWSKVNLRRELEARLDCPVIVERDTGMAALGEYHFGQVKKASPLLYVTISTGIGAGIILDGHLFRGFNNGAGEVGHMVIDPQGPICNCGRRGCIEALASGAAINRQASAWMEAAGAKTLPGTEVTAVQIGQWAQAGNNAARQIVDQILEYWAVFIADLVHAYDPEKIVLGGGVALGWEKLILSRLPDLVRHKVFKLHGNSLNIEITRLGEDVVLLGCAAVGGGKFY